MVDTRESFRRWHRKHGQPVSELADEIGDRGGQLTKWASGNRRTLPLRLKVALAEATGIPLFRLLERDERDLLRRVVRLVG